MSNQTRSIGLDALRGTAILLMIFSGVIPFGGALPAWMYHAQVPPPEHIFKPEVPGITWVDLVFPFFLFSMGAAVPFALPRRLFREGLKGTVLHIARRYLFLLLFAVISFNMAPLRIPDAGPWANFIGIAAYFALFLAFVESPVLGSLQRRIFRALGWSILAVLAVLLILNFRTFDPAVNDPIIRVLATVYLVGSIIWLFTRERPLLRAAIALLFLAFYLGGSESGTWVNRIWMISAPWNLASPFLLKYLLLFIPGTLAGDWLIAGPGAEEKSGRSGLFLLLAALLTGIALWSLFVRAVGIGFALTLVLVVGCLVLILVRKRGMPFSSLEQLFLGGGILLLAGYLCEPFQGGIHKDHSTLSYFFVTGGLAALWAGGFEETAGGVLGKAWRPLATVGQNALMAYLMAGFLLAPLFAISGLSVLFAGSIAMQVVKALLLTAIAGGIAALCAKRNFFWKL